MLQQPKNQQDKPAQHPVDQQALHFTRNWRRHSVFTQAVSFEGVDLAEMNELDIFLRVLQTLFESHAGGASK